MRVVMPRLRIFVASSTEGLAVAYAIQENLDHEFEVSVWSQGAFELTRTSIESIEQRLTRCDAAIFVFSPDDQAIVRGTAKPAVRDNVLFELGLFIGRLGRDRCFVVKPRSWLDFAPPSDLLGVTLGDFEDNRADGDLPAALGSFCSKVRRKLVPATVPTPDPNIVFAVVAPSLEDYVTSQAFRLFYNPPRNGSKRMLFARGGQIIEGNNKNEHAWRIVNDKLELLRLDGAVQSRFTFDEQERKFKHTNEADTASLRNQFIVEENN